MDSSKQKKWRALVKKFSKTGDKLGNGIDKGILETVVALNALGINTRQSCEGHLKWGTCAPWVDVKAANTRALEKLKDEAWERAQKDDRLYEEFHKTRVRLKSKNLTVAKKLWRYLEMFYEGRIGVDFSTRLVLWEFGDGIARLESQGAMLQEATPLRTRKINLLKYQKEMAKFTKFLKGVYFGTRIEP